MDFGNAAYFTKTVKVNGTDVHVRSFYAGKDSKFQEAADAFEENPVAEKFTDSEFYKIEKWIKIHLMFRHLPILILMKATTSKIIRL